jgi:enoyl-CoA hydratase/carnithine racemase
MPPLILAAFAKGVCRLMFNRPTRRNAISDEMLEAVYEELRMAEADPAFRCLVIDGAGEHFMAGGDIKSRARLRTMEPAARGDDFRQRLNAVYPLVDRLDAPQAPELGLVDEVVAADAFEGDIAKLADKTTAAPALAVMETKKLLNLSQHSTLLTQFSAEVHGLGVCASDPGFMEAVESFSERRTPQFIRAR